MQIHKNEIATGLLVLGTLAGFLALLVVIGIPGLIKPLNTYRIYFDNAAGIRSGSPVLLAGREIGKVTVLHSPVPLDKRPNGHPDYEVSIDVQVAREAEIYRDVKVRLTQQSLMGVSVIDFVQGDASAGLAKNHTEFIGERIPDISEAMENDMKRLTGPDSDLAHTIQNVEQLTEPDSDMALTLKNVKQLTGPDSQLALTIKNAKTFMDTLNDSHISQTLENTEQLTDTLKREPWRLVWPSTKTYPGDKKTTPEKKK
jgi:ABC-type transporter Mla subunit MlaD